MAAVGLRGLVWLRLVGVHRLFDLGRIVLMPMFLSWLCLALLGLPRLWVTAAMAFAAS